MVSKLILSEDFYSIQGEGKSVGAPSVFLRLAGCNLRCEGFTYKNQTTGRHLGCDTREVWERGRRVTFTELLQKWGRCGWLEKLKKGAHLVVTGGEPLIQQAGLLAFIHELDQAVGMLPYIEIETNATFELVPALLARINQINASPKLYHSGEALLNEVALQQLSDTPKAVFKFVVRGEADMAEIQSRYLKPFGIACQRVWLMPEGGTQVELMAKQASIIEMAKAHAMHYSTRLHLLVWDQATGV